MTTFKQKTPKNYCPIHEIPLTEGYVISGRTVEDIGGGLVKVHNNYIINTTGKDIRIKCLKCPECGYSII